MVGILVHGNNHFILSGPLPDDATALALVRHWSIIQIGELKSSSFGQWQIRNREFQENLEWAVITWKTFRSRRDHPQIVIRLLIARRGGAVSLGRERLGSSTPNGVRGSWPD